MMIYHCERTAYPALIAYHIEVPQSVRAFLAKIIWYNLRNNLTSDYFSQGVPTIKIIQIISKIICHINKNKLSMEIIEPHKSCASGTIDYPTFYHHYP
jgi:hypothetical protein